MATVPQLRPQVANRPDAPVYQSAQGATVDAFGGAQATAIHNLGQAGVQAGSTALRVAATMEQEDNERYAKDGLINLQKYQLEQIYGTPDKPGFLATQGEHAVRASGDVLASIQARRKEIAETLKDRPASQRMFDLAAAPYELSSHQNIMAHTSRERIQASVATSNARIDLATQQAALEGQNDHDALMKQLGVIRAEVQGQADLYGYSSEVVESKFREQATKVLTNVIGLRGATDATGAMAMLKRYAPHMDPQAVMRITEHLRPRVISQTADSLTERDWMIATGGAVTEQVALGRIHGNESGRSTAKGVYGDGGAAAGVMQVHQAALDDVNRELGTSYTHKQLADDPEIGKKVGDTYFRQQVKAFGGDIAKAAAAYNAGPETVRKAVTALGDRWMEGIPEATRGYVARVVGTPGKTAGVTYPDRSAMEAQIIKETEGEPEMRQARLSRLATKFALLNHQVEGERTEIVRAYNDAEVALRSGRDDVTVPESQIRAAFPKARADDMIANLNVAREAGLIFRGVQWASPEDIAATRAQLMAPGDPATAAARKKTLDQFDAAMETRNKALQGPQADPAAYLAAHPLVQAARQPNATMTPETAMLVAQRQMGVGEYDLRLLTNGQVDQINGHLRNLDPTKANMGAEMTKLAEKYGEHWPRVFGELVRQGKLDPVWKTMAIAPNNVRDDLQRTLVLKEKLGDKFHSSIPAAEKAGFDDAIDRAMAPFLGTTRAGGVQAGLEMKQAVRDLTTYYVLQGDNARKAASRAYDALIGQKWDTEGVTRTPKGMMDKVLDAGAGLQTSLTPEAIQPFPIPGSAMTPDEARKNTLILARNGVWVATPDDTGVQLVTKMTDGGYRELKWADGRPIAMQFDRLPATTRRRAPDVLPIPAVP